VLIIAEAKTFPFCFGSLEDARKDFEYPRTPLGLKEDNLYCFEGTKAKIAVLRIMKAFLRPYAELPPAGNTIDKQEWVKWQQENQKKVQVFLDDKEQTVEVERAAWLYVGEIFDLHRNGYRHNTIVNKRLKCIQRVQESYRMIAVGGRAGPVLNILIPIQAYSVIGLNLLRMREPDQTKFAAHPSKYAEARVKGFAKRVKDKARKQSTGRGSQKSRESVSESDVRKTEGDPVREQESGSDEEDTEQESTAEQESKSDEEETGQELAAEQEESDDGLEED